MIRGEAKVSLSVMYINIMCTAYIHKSFKTYIQSACVYKCVHTSSWYMTNSGFLLKRAEDGWMNTGWLSTIYNTA